MEIELSEPVVHDAVHEVDIVIENAPRVFACANFVCLGLNEADVRHLCEELQEWLHTK